MNLPAVLDNIIDLLKNKGESVLGVDIGSSSIKVVQLRSKTGKALLETYGEIALGPYAEKEIGRAVKLPAEILEKALNDVIRESNATTRTCGISVPLSSSIITTMSIPNIAGDLDEIVAMEARRYVPVSMSEITLDWQVIPEALNSDASAQSTISPLTGEAVVSEGARPASKTTNVILVAVYTDTVNRLKELAEGTKMDCRFFELEAFSAMRVILNHSTKVSAVADIGASSSKVYVVDGGIIRSSHVIPIGSQDLTFSISRALGVSVDEAEKMKRKGGIENDSKLSPLFNGSVSFVLSEVWKVLNEYQKRNNTVVEELVLTGGGVIVSGVSNFFKDKLKVPVRVADPFSTVEAPAFLEGVLKNIGPSFSVAIGAAIRALTEERAFSLSAPGNK